MRKREEEKVAKEAKLANLRIFAQRQKAAVEAAKNAQIKLILSFQLCAACSWVSQREAYHVYTAL